MATGRDTPVTLRLPGRSLRRWHLALAQILSARGHRVAVTMAACGTPDIAGLGVVRMMDITLYNARLQGEADFAGTLPEAAFSSFRTPNEGGLTLDCTETDPTSAAPDVLVPMFDGCPDVRGILTALVDDRAPQIGWRRAGDGAMVAAGTAAIARRHVLTQSFSETLARLVSMAPAAVIRASNPAPALAQVPAVAPLAAGFGTGGGEAGSLTAGIGRHAARALTERLMGRLTRSLTDAAQWNIGWRMVEEGQGILATATLPVGDFRWLPRSPRAYYADPFPFVHAGKTWLFCEEFPFATNKGIICVAECADDGTPGPMVPVLETSCHMSYPAVFEHEGEILMMPETTGNRTLELYRADPFPHRWVRHSVLMSDVYVGDATLFRHDNRVWLAATTDDNGATDRDSLSLYHAPKLGEAFTPHPLNPVVVNVCGARPAGWLERCADGLRRPGQDCTGGYGWGLAIARIDQLDTETYRETQIAAFPPPASLKASGLHTVNRAGRFETIDAIL